MRAFRYAFGAGVAGAAAAVWAVACSGPESESHPTAAFQEGPIGETAGHVGGTGSVGLTLTIGNNVNIYSLSWSISNGVNSYSGTSPIGDAQSAEFVAGGIVAGSGYVVTISGADSNGDPCSGSSAPITVRAGATSSAIVAVVCTAPPDGSVSTGVETGSVEVDASVTLTNGPRTVCPAIASFSISPAEIAVGQSAQLSLIDTDPTAVITWSVSAVLPAGAGGTFSDPHSANPTFACSLGSSQVSVTASIAPANDAAAAMCVGQPNQTISALVNCEGQSADAGADAGTCGSGTFGTGCGDGGQVCNGVGQCVPAVFEVAVVGSADGGAIANNNSAYPLSVQKFTLAGAPVGNAVALPAAASGSNNPCTLMGNAITEGDLTTSADGRYLTMMCWASVPGVSINGVPPVVARIDGVGNVDTSTTVAGAFTGGGNNASSRSAVSANGGGFWVSGTSSSTVTPGNTGGVWYVPFGADGGAAQLLALPNPGIAGKARWSRIFGGQLYGDSDQAPPYLFSVGSGLPTSGSQTPTEFAGLPSDGGTPATVSAYGFLLFNLHGSSGFDTAYVADDRTSVGGGLSKLQFNGSTWAFAWTVTAGTSDAGTPIGFRGLAGFATGGTVTLMTSTAASHGNPNQLAVIVDNGGAPPVPAIVASSSASQVFRGVALAPHN